MEDPTDQPIRDPLIGMLIDERYRVQSRLARGGMASVYIATDERLDRPVALKVMHPHLAESKQFAARFRQEARAAAKISHPGVVPVFDQGVVEGQGYLVMELVEGHSLRQILESESLTLRDALDYTLQVLSAIGAAHNVGVVHRDLKPENVLIDAEGRLRVVDFGLARAASEISLSSTGSILGTVAYLAPEVAQNGDFDSRTDIYAVGLMLFEMLTGELPWQGNNPLSIAYARVKEDVPAPSTLVKWLPTEVDNLVAALCARDRADRPLSAEEASTAVQKTLDAVPESALDRHLPLRATPPEAAEGATKQLIPLGKTTPLPIREQVVHTSGAATKTQSSPKSKSQRVPVIILIVVLLLGASVAGVWWWQSYGPGAYVDVPNVAGKTLEQAESLLAESNLETLTQYEYSDDVPKGSVIGSHPESGSRAPKKSPVTLVVSNGVQMLTVPDVIGRDSKEAEELLKDAGLTLSDATEKWSEQVPEGNVVSTDPAPGRSVRHDTQVTLTISKGREPIPVPTVVGKTTAEAEEAITDLGLLFSTSEAYSDQVGAGAVISQDPAEGNLYLGDTVKLTVSLGPEYIEVPSVQGMSLTEAKAALESAGFTVEVNRLASFFDAVGSQSPAGGESARKGSTVTLTVV